MIRQTINLRGPADVRSIRRAMEDETQSPPTLLLGGLAAHFETWVGLQEFIGTMERGFAEGASKESQI